MYTLRNLFCNGNVTDKFDKKWVKVQMQISFQNREFQAQIFTLPLFTSPIFATTSAPQNLSTRAQRRTPPDAQTCELTHTQALCTHAGFSPVMTEWFATVVRLTMLVLQIITIAASEAHIQDVPADHPSVRQYYLPERRRSCREAIRGWQHLLQQTKGEPACEKVRKDALMLVDSIGAGCDAFEASDVEDAAARAREEGGRLSECALEVQERSGRELQASCTGPVCSGACNCDCRCCPAGNSENIYRYGAANGACGGSWCNCAACGSRSMCDASPPPTSPPAVPPTIFYIQGDSSQLVIGPVENHCRLEYTAGATPSLTSSCAINQPAGRRLQDNEALVDTHAKIASIEERLAAITKENLQLKAEIKALREA